MSSDSDKPSGVGSNRPNALKFSDSTKYTDVARTSSSSFKPPMSKDNLTKKVADTPRTDASWFSYIKTYFGNKPAVADASQIKKAAEKVKKTSNNIKDQPKKEEAKVAVVEKPKRTSPIHFGRDNWGPTILSDSKSVTEVSQQRSPRNSFTAEQATGKRNQPKPKPARNHSYDNLETWGPKYNQLRFVENKSTYLHTPEKKGTTSFRITTSNKVKNPPPPPVVKMPTKKKFSSPTLARKRSESPKKIPNGENATRLRSKSTPDPTSNAKQRPVSESPQSLKLNISSNKVVRQYPNDSNENKGTVVADVKIFRNSWRPKPTIVDGSKSVTDIDKRKTLCSSSKPGDSKSRVPSKTAQLTCSASVGDALAQRKVTSDCNSSRSGQKKSRFNPPPKSIELGHDAINKSLVQKREPLLISNHNLNKTRTSSKSSICTNPSKNTDNNENNLLKKFQHSMELKKEKMKSRNEIPEAQAMILSPTAKRDQTFDTKTPKSGPTLNWESSHRGQMFLRSGNPESVPQISPTIARAPIKQPSPPGVMCLTILPGTASDTTTMPKEKDELPCCESPMKYGFPTSAVVQPTSYTNDHSGPDLAMTRGLVSHAGIFSSVGPCKKGDSLDPYPTMLHPSESIAVHDSSIIYGNKSNNAALDESDEFLLTGLGPDETSDACEAEQDQCNSALPGNAITDGSLSMQSSGSLIDDDTQHSSEVSTKSQFLQSLDPIEFVANKASPKESTFYEVLSKARSSPSTRHASREPSINRTNDVTKSSRRRFSVDTSTTTMEKSKSAELQVFQLSKTPINTKAIKFQNRSPQRPNVQLSHEQRSPDDRNPKPVHNSPFVRAPDPSLKNGSGYLKAISQVNQPTVTEPTRANGSPGAKPHMKRSPRVSPYFKSPSLDIGSIASSIQDTIGSFATSLRKSFPSVTKLTVSPERPKREKKADKKKVLAPTETADKPLSATMAYISTCLDDKSLPYARQSKRSFDNAARKKDEMNINTVTDSTDKAIPSEQTQNSLDNSKQRPLKASFGPFKKDKPNSIKEKEPPSKVSKEDESKTPEKSPLKFLTGLDPSNNVTVYTRSGEFP